MGRIVPITILSYIGLFSLVSCSISSSGRSESESSPAISVTESKSEVVSSSEVSTSESCEVVSVEASSEEVSSPILPDESSFESSVEEISETPFESSEEDMGEGSSSDSSGESSDPPEEYSLIPTLSKRMPGEFEPCEMVKMCYPNNMPLSVYKAISEDNRILLLTNPSQRGSSRIQKAKTELSNAGANMDNITFLDMPMDGDYNYWVRDFSPFYVFNEEKLSIADFTYNRPDRVNQNGAPAKLADYFGMDYSLMDIVHTGGNLMQDGRGTAFSDDLVLSENDMRKDHVLSEMEKGTGTERYVITIDPQGDYIAHIDCWAKIVAPDKIIVARMPKGNPRYRYYEQVAKELGETKSAYGYNYRIYRVDEPGGNTVAPYTNSLIANNHVYLPLGEDEDYNKAAIEVYKEALPGYEIVGLEGFPKSSDSAFLNTDALHCRTHEVPDDEMVFIDSREVYRGEVEKQDEYLIKANVVSYAGVELGEGNVRIHYSINEGPYQEKGMNRYGGSTNFTFTFAGLESGDTVSYYIEADDGRGHVSLDPTCGEKDPHAFFLA